ncbi:MAG: flagellar motor protein MotB [Alcaligenaceae bacterium]
MAEDIQSPIVVKKIKKVAGGHHGGAWKIAYADFVTAMMAFFLLMWLLGSQSAGDLSGIAEYFKTPLKVAMQGGSGAGASNSILVGGGRTLTTKVGQDRVVEDIPTKKTVNPRVPRKKPDVSDYEFLKKTEMDRLKGLEQQLKQMIESNPNLSQFKNQIMIDIDTDGLRIQIVDEKNRAMFSVAKAELEPYAKVILRAMGPMINSVPNKIKISGHTDALPFNAGNKAYGNWELSAERANAARRELINGDMDADKVLQIDGMGSAVPFDKDNPLNPVNRRIAIIVMNMKAEARVRGDQKMLSIIEATEAETLLQNLEDQQKAEDEAQQPGNPIAPAGAQPLPTVEREDAKTPASGDSSKTEVNGTTASTTETSVIILLLAPR